MCTINQVAPFTSAMARIKRILFTMKSKYAITCECSDDLVPFALTAEVQFTHTHGNQRLAELLFLHNTTHDLKSVTIGRILHSGVTRYWWCSSP
jgi:esterase/lipase